MAGRQFQKRYSRSNRVNRRVWFAMDDDTYEYEKDPRPDRGTWHEINWRQNEYRDIDPATGTPVGGSEGKWRPLR